MIDGGDSGHGIRIASRELLDEFPLPGEHLHSVIDSIADIHEPSS